MARIAFVMDRIFRKFGLSGKSFIPILVGTGCGIPGIMASRTIENERDRRMTVMTTTFIPCGAKQPFIAMIAGAIFGGSAWIATGAYFLGMAAIVVSGIILKKTKKSEREENIKPGIMTCELRDDQIYMLLSTGSEYNLKPELVMQALCAYADVSHNQFHYHIHRLETYMDGPDGNIIPLYKAGSPF